MTHEAGRETDALVAERLGHSVERVDGEAYFLPGERRLEDRVAWYSEDMADAWPVAEWIRERTGEFALSWESSAGHWEAGVFWVDGAGVGITATADTAPLAICRAALALVEGEK